MKPKGDAAYTQAVSSGRYAFDTGMLGKYDNVRRYWEDEITRIFIAPFIQALEARRRRENAHMRLLDLGCGSGDGFETLMNMKRLGPANGGSEALVIDSSRLGAYKGIDVNESLLEQARTRFARNEKIAFKQADLSKGLPFDSQEAPYDIYFTSFGTMSHFHNDEAVRLVSDIARHASDGALIVADWLGRYSYEWQQLWNTNISREQWMDYRISYIYPEEQRNSMDIAILPLRLVCRQEIESMISEAREKTGIQIAPKKIFDRSVLVGRHMDTAEYNSFAPPIRRAANSLYNDFCRTDMQSLIFDYHPQRGFDACNDYFARLATVWNAAVSLVLDTFSHLKMDNASGVRLPDSSHNAPKDAQSVLKSLSRVMIASQCFEFGDVRAEIMEPQLAYALRSIEMLHSSGGGYGHGLVGVFEVQKQ
jgi:SAM-dependent methyltransferase